MQTRDVIFITLVLAVLCLGSASNAMAQSVTGGGTVHPGANDQLVINVSARSGPAGIIHIRENAGDVFAEVVTLCVPPAPGNEAIVVGQVTRSTERDCAVDEYIVLVVQDNRNSGDRVTFACFETELQCDEVPFTANLELTEGNITVTP